MLTKRTKPVISGRARGVPPSLKPTGILFVIVETFVIFVIDRGQAT
jgi:hypothetical protein